MDPQNPPCLAASLLGVLIGLRVPILPIVITVMFVLGVALLIVALALECVAMGISRRTIAIGMSWRGRT